MLMLIFLWLQDILLIKSCGVVVRSLNPLSGGVKGATYNNR
jgi:hypothetical protein